MTPRQNNSDNRDDRQAVQMGEIKATLENAARERSETRELMHQIQKTLTGIEIAIGRLTVLQEQGERRLEKIEHSIGQDDSGLGARMTKLEGLIMLDESEVSALTSRVTANENKLKDYDKKILGTLAAAVVALLGMVLNLAGIYPHH